MRASSLRTFFARLPIRVKLGSIFFFAFLLIFAVMVFFYINVNATVQQIDEVYASNTRLNDLRDTLEEVQSNLYQYLNTRGSEALENYYFFEAEYKRQLELLNEQTLGDTPQLMEKNIRNISVVYLQRTNEAIEAKRARNISLYRELYEETGRFYRYLDATIQAANDINFRQNSANYLVLRGVLDMMTGAGVIFLLLIVTLAIIWSLLMTQAITEPLVLMARAANEIADGNMEAHFPYVDTLDEMGAVAKASNKMLDHIREYIETIKAHMVLESQLKENELMMRSDLNEAQLNYLQAQINPHFLFNTLNAGVQLSMLEGANRTGVFLENVADFFRYNVKKMREDTTLQEELQLLDNYIYILNVRYMGEITFEKQYDETLLNWVMPSMVLQPIVENAVSHGIQKTEEEGIITLSIYPDGDIVVIRVQDNGAGIEPDIARRIMEGEDLHGDSGTGIGLDNVRNRLRRYFNQDDVFVIRRREDIRGTEVLLRLPLQ
ncbi:MAG: histidine kinase [Lachnospiraceae bacterium]|nr:histidine kinase [Lachnospiraceae bacterium]